MGRLRGCTFSAPSGRCALWTWDTRTHAPIITHSTSARGNRSNRSTVEQLRLRHRPPLDRRIRGPALRLGRRRKPHDPSSFPSGAPPKAGGSTMVQTMVMGDPTHEAFRPGLHRLKAPHFVHHISRLVGGEDQKASEHRHGPYRRNQGDTRRNRRGAGG